MCARLEDNAEKIHRVYHVILMSMAVEGWGLVLKGSRDSNGEQQAIQVKEVLQSVCGSCPLVASQQVCDQCAS